MSDNNWGPCKSCKFFQIEPKATAENRTMGHCIQHEIEPFHLRVSGNSGCDRFAPGKPVHAAGASESPPKAD